MDRSKRAEYEHLHSNIHQIEEIETPHPVQENEYYLKKNNFVCNLVFKCLHHQPLTTFG